jgi:ATP-binding cassette, subfamily B, bacterial
MSKEEKLTWSTFWSMIGPAFAGTFWYYALVLSLIVISAVAQVAEPVIFGKILDEILAGPDNLLQREIPMLVMWVGAFIVSIIITEIAQWLSWHIGHKVNIAFFHDMMIRVIAWDPERFGKESGGAIAKRIDQAWERSFDIASRGLVDIAPQAIGFVVVLITGIVLDWRMTIASLITVPVVLFLTLKVYVKTEKKQDALGTAWEGLSTQIHEMLQNILPIKIFSGEVRTLKKLEDQSKEVSRRQERLDVIWNMLGAGNGLIRLIARLIIVLVGITFIMRGEITVGILTAFLGMLNQLLSPFDYLLADILRRARRAQSAFAKLSKDWFAVNRIIEDKKPIRLIKPIGQIQFDHVSYRYAGKTKDALRDISFSIPAGSSLALVGRSGSGKSTLVKFVNRFLDPSSGTITIDGIDLKRAKIHDVRSAVGVVQQDTVLFNDTIANNIRFAQPKASLKDIEASCKAAQAHEFIAKLPKGYNTIVGERGVRLSGGERQRLSLARVFLANPPILILDESTSALDSETESLVQEALSHVMKGRTTIVIAHRLSTVYMADRIVVLDDGSVVEMGTHAELLRKGGMYERLWKLQSGGYLPE